MHFRTTAAGNRPNRDVVRQSTCRTINRCSGEAANAGRVMRRAWTGLMVEYLQIAAGSGLSALPFKERRTLAYLETLMLTSAGSASFASTSIALMIPTGTGQAACGQNLAPIWRV